jgi:hypothetical protein
MVKKDGKEKPNGTAAIAEYMIGVATKCFINFHSDQDHVHTKGFVLGLRNQAFGFEKTTTFKEPSTIALRFPSDPLMQLFHVEIDVT